MLTNLMPQILLLLYVLCASLGLISIKLGSKAGPPVAFLNGHPAFNLNFYIMGGIVLYGLSFIVYTYLVSKNDLGYIIPLTTALVYIVIFLASYIIFHEVFTEAKILGIILIVAGLIFLNLRG